jgi:putative phosphoribosyl transferase
MSGPARFRDLAAAGRALAPALRDLATPDLLVLGIASGGVPVAAEIARELQLPFDVVVRKVMLQTAGELAGAVNVAGHRSVDEAATATDARTAIGRHVAEELEKFDRRVLASRGARQAARIESRSILLVDDGMRTGETMRACVRATRALNPGMIAVAVPVADPAAISTIDPDIKVVCLHSIVPFGHVGMFYEAFDVPDESRIRTMFESAN